MLRRWLVRLRALIRRQDVETEFDEELRFHLDREIERRIAAGMTAESARRAAMRGFGDLHRVKEEARETWRWRWVDELLQDIRYAMRGLRRSRGFTTVAALSLGFGIGATTTLFSVIDALDLRPLPYRDAERLVWLGEVRPSDDRSCPGCPFGTLQSTAAHWNAQARSLESVALWSNSDAYVRQGDVAENISVGYASAGFFEFLGVDLLFGRDIAIDDTVSGAEAVALLSYETWQTRFGGERDVLGARFEYYSDPALTAARVGTVVGVLPQGFQFGGDASMWLAMSGAEANRFTDAVARLEASVSRESAEAELRAIATGLAELDGRNEPRDVSVLPLRERLGWSAGQGRVLVFGVTVLVLMLAVMNVTGLSLARTISRRSELTVRSSLGASPMRIARQLVVEGICLSLIGAAIGGLLLIWGTRAASHWFRIEGAGVPLTIDRRVLAFSLGIAVVVGILTALLPSVWASRWNRLVLGDRSDSTLRPGVRRATAALLVLQIASGLVLLTGAGVLSSEFLKLRYLDLGFEPQRLYQVSLFGTRELRADPEAWRPRLEEVRRRIANVQGVESVSLWHSSAIDPAVVRPEGSTDVAPGTRTPRVQAVDASYFETFGTSVLAGDAFTAADGRGGRAVCVINAAAAAAFWPNERALGRQVFVGDSTQGELLTVIGVVADVEQGEMVQRHWPTIYRPLDQAPLYHPAASLYVRLSGRNDANLSAMQRAVGAALGHPAAAFRPVASDLDRRFRTQRLNTYAFNLFAGFALLLAAMGIHGSVAYAVSRRTREIGVRVALGAQRGRVLKLVTEDTTSVVAIGLALGLLGSLVLTRGLRIFVSATSTADPRTFAVAALVAGMVALIATWLPARRATGVDPLIAMRSD